jgi:cell division protein FtsZ
MTASHEKRTEDLIHETSLDRIVPRIAVIGVGGAGGNAVDNMIRSGLQGVSFLVCNTDAQALSQSLCPENQRIRLGFGVTQGLGAGSSPEVGKLAAEESIQEVLRHLKGIHMVFITAGMGGGTGTGAGPVIACAAKEQGILTVGVVTKPFHFEGAQRMRAADKGIEVIRQCVDTLLVIPNQNLFRLANQNTTFVEAFALADDVLYSGVRTFTDMMINPGLVNCDFADICTVMRNTSGKTMMGTGEATGESRATEATEKAIGCMLLDNVSINGAQSVLINVTGGQDLKLYDVDEAIGRIKQEVEHEFPGRELARIIFGATFEKDLEGVVRVSVVATGIQDPALTEPEPPVTAPLPTMETLLSDDPLSAPFSSMGSRHSAYDFEETPFASFALQEDSPDSYNGEDHESENDFGYTPKARPAPTTFLQRLMGLGRKKEQAMPLYPKAPKNMDKPSDKFSEPGSEDLEVPYFLRQKPKNRKER